ncbi:hypothetical protein [Maioricimonas rarisocia]|nr:hypothetical protein [Maioricimonas rarisocia]
MNTQSLTVRILGDSSHLQNELSRVLDQVQQLQKRMADLTPAAGNMANGLSRVATAVRPLQQVQQMLAGVTQQVRALSRTPVTLNVAPALQALQRLRAAIEAVASLVRSLGGGGGGPAPMSPPRPPLGRPYAAGGLVTGPPGRDRVPARLSAGEFVLRAEAVRDLGLDSLHRLNAGTAPSSERTAPSAAPSPTESSATTNHFGGITVNVRETADVSRLVQELRWQGIDLRHRRG